MCAQSYPSFPYLLSFCVRLCFVPSSLVFALTHVFFIGRLFQHYRMYLSMPDHQQQDLEISTSLVVTVPVRVYALDEALPLAEFEEATSTNQTEHEVRFLFVLCAHCVPLSQVRTHTSLVQADIDVRASS